MSTIDEKLLGSSATLNNVDSLLQKVQDMNNGEDGIFENSELIDDDDEDVFVTEEKRSDDIIPFSKRQSDRLNKIQRRRSERLKSVERKNYHETRISTRRLSTRKKSNRKNSETIIKKEKINVNREPLPPQMVENEVTQVTRKKKRAAENNDDAKHTKKNIRHIGVREKDLPVYRQAEILLKTNIKKIKEIRKEEKEKERNEEKTELDSRLENMSRFDEISDMSNMFNNAKEDDNMDFISRGLDIEDRFNLTPFTFSDTIMGRSARERDRLIQRNDLRNNIYSNINDTASSYSVPVERKIVQNRPENNYNHPVNHEFKTKVDEILNQKTFSNVQPNEPDRFVKRDPQYANKNIADDEDIYSNLKNNVLFGNEDIEKVKPNTNEQVDDLESMIEQINSEIKLYETPVVVSEVAGSSLTDNSKEILKNTTNAKLPDLSKKKVTRKIVRNQIIGRDHEEYRAFVKKELDNNRNNTRYYKKDEDTDEDL